jgi:MinD-like ATPase involved in chromosome partitioning or flagellar assembly
MIAEPTVALVFSPEIWVEELHRHLADHGGARVRQIVVEPTVALDEEYDALVVSDRWPALTRSFVEAIHARGRRLLGVFDPQEPAGKDHLLALGVDTSIPADAPVAEFVAAIASLAPNGSASAARSVLQPQAPAASGIGDESWGHLVAVTGTRGSGVTEVALALAAAAADRRSSVVLVDAHETAPALAGRLGLGLEPNLRSAVDARAHGLGDLDNSIVRSRAGAGTGFDVVGGFPSPSAARQVTARDVLDVLAALQRLYRYVVVDVDGSLQAPIGRAVLAESTAIVGVGAGAPVGVARLLEWMDDARSIAPAATLHAVVNRAPRDRFRQAEIASELRRAGPPSSLVFAPTDRRVEDAGWDGGRVPRGPFVTALAPLAAMVVPQPTGRRGRTRRRGRTESGKA